MELLAPPGAELRRLPTAIPGSPVLALDEGTRETPHREVFHPAPQTPNPLTHADVRFAVMDPFSGIPPEAFPRPFAPVRPIGRASPRSGGACTRMFTTLRVAAAVAAGRGGRVRP